MLSYDSLKDHAVERGMPAGKLRGAVREYLQVLALKSLFGRRDSSALAFLGGTALRLGYDLPRFSEDLDFDAEGLAVSDWKALVEDASHGLERRGFLVEASAGERGSLLTGELRFRRLLQPYRLASDPNEKLSIKLEANRPRWPVAREPRVVSGWGELVPVPFASTGVLAAEKLVALLSRELGRDVYDLFFICGRRWRFDPAVLKAAKIQAPAVAAIDRVRSLGGRKLVSMARRLEPFLFKPEEARLVAEADELLPSALEYLRNWPGD